MNDLRVTFIQASLHWENIPANLDMFDKKIASIREETDLIVLPEMFSTGFTMNNKSLAEKPEGRTMQWMRRKAKEKNAVVAGSHIATEDGKYFNRLVWMRPDGTFETYDKRHLFRYANEQDHYTAGNRKLIVELKGWKLCPMICYDLRFPVWIRNASAPAFGYDVLIFVANWPERRSHPWKILGMARAIENLSYVIAVNRVGDDGNNVYHSGDSAVINYKGEVISKTRAQEESAETVTLSYAELAEFRKNFPAGMDADEFVVHSS